MSIFGVDLLVCLVCIGFSFCLCRLAGVWFWYFVFMVLFLRFVVVFCLLWYFVCLDSLALIVGLFDWICLLILL